MDRTPPKPFGRLIPAIIAVVVGVALAEVVFRIAVFPDWKAVSQATFVHHPIYDTFQKPNLEVRRLNPPNYDVINRTNSLGFRDREEGFEEDLAGIWAAGASNAYGGFVEDHEAFPSVLQDMGYKIANFSSEGHRLGNQVKVVRHLTSQGYRPRAIVFEMTLNNVLGRYDEAIADMKQPLKIPELNAPAKPASTATAQLKSQLGKLLESFEVSKIGIKGRLINNSAIYCWLKVGINGVPMFRKWALKAGLREDVALKDSAPPDVLRNLTKTPEDNVIHSTVDFTVALKDWIDSTLGVPFGVVLIPSHHQLDGASFARYERHLGFKQGELDASRPYRLLLRGLTARGITVLDTAPALMASDKFLSFPDDGHMNATAHRIVAEEIAAWLPRKLGLDPDL